MVVVVLRRWFGSGGGVVDEITLSVYYVMKAPRINSIYSP